MLLVRLKGEGGFFANGQPMHMQVIPLDQGSSLQKCLSKISVIMQSSLHYITYSYYIVLIAC